MFVQYRTIFGENPDHNEISFEQLVIYIAFTIIICIVNMNLMISIIAIQLDELQLN